jgi:hypothetical protein
METQSKTRGVQISVRAGKAPAIGNPAQYTAVACGASRSWQYVRHRTDACGRKP